jgi:hypothetical protein
MSACEGAHRCIALPHGTPRRARDAPRYAPFTTALIERWHLHWRCTRKGVRTLESARATHAAPAATRRHTRQAGYTPHRVCARQCSALSGCGWQRKHLCRVCEHTHTSAHVLGTPRPRIGGAACALRVYHAPVYAAVAAQRLAARAHAAAAVHTPLAKAGLLGRCACGERVCARCQAWHPRIRRAPHQNSRLRTDGHGRTQRASRTRASANGKPSASARGFAHIACSHATLTRARGERTRTRIAGAHGLRARCARA